MWRDWFRWMCHVKRPEQLWNMLSLYLSWYNLYTILRNKINWKDPDSVYSALTTLWWNDESSDSVNYQYFLWTLCKVGSSQPKRNLRRLVSNIVKEFCGNFSHINLHEIFMTYEHKVSKHSCSNHWGVVWKCPHGVKSYYWEVSLQLGK